MTDSPERRSNMLRHTVATLAYRGGKALRGAPAGVLRFRGRRSADARADSGAHVRSLRLGADTGEWRAASGANSNPGAWEADVARFFAATGGVRPRGWPRTRPLGCDAERLFQGPIADALTHVGQIAMLRRLAGAPIKGENYYKASIESGRTGPGQPAPVVEF